MNENRTGSIYFPKTYDAIYFGGHYKDPRTIKLRIKCVVSVTAFVAAIALPLLYMLH